MWIKCAKILFKFVSILVFFVLLSDTQRGLHTIKRNELTQKINKKKSSKEKFTRKPKPKLWQKTKTKRN